MNYTTSSFDSFCSNELFPFDFFDVNGSVISNGVMNEDGLCVFPEANCGVDNSIIDCCQAKPEYSETGAKFMYIAFCFIMIPYFYLMEKGKEKGTEEENKVKNQKQDENVEDGSDDPKDKQDMDDKKNGQRDPMIPSWVPDGLAAKIFGLGLFASITVQIMIPIFMRDSIQEKLDASSRNTIIASEAFLLPYNEIFQFIEDIVLVRVNYALGTGNKRLTDQLVHVGMVGSFVTGLIAAIIGTILGVVPSILEALTQPGVEHDASLYPGCDLIGLESNSVLPYWLGEVWAIPGTQLGMVLSGFFLGAMELPTTGWFQAISVSMIPIIWFSTVDQASNKILMLALAEFTSKWIFPAMAITYIVSPLGKDLREHTGFELRIHKLWKSFDAFRDDATVHHQNDTTEQKERPALAGQPSASMDGVDGGPDNTKALLMDGLKIMVMDVVIQLCNSLSIYLALMNSGADGYKITSLQSALPTYGIAYAFGMGLMFKIVGPQLIAHKAFAMFATFARISMVCAFLLVPLILGAVIPFRSGMMVEYGGNACQYAKSEECLPFFTHVLGDNAQGGDYTLEYTFNAFALGACIEALFFVLRSALLALVDLDYMLWGTLVAVIVYVPCVAVAATVPPFGGHAIAFFVTMFIPETVLCILFTLRVEKLIRRVEQGEDGSWTSKSQRKIEITD